MDAFVAHTTIEPTHEWEKVIETALSSCNALTALVTENFVESKWCDQEVGYCVARQVPIVPIKLGADPHGFIAKYQAATVAAPGTAPWVADAIFRALTRHPASRDRMALPVVRRYAESTSFDGARANFDLLREIPSEAWTRELVEIAEQATQENGQIAGARVLKPENKPMPEAAGEILAPIRDRLGMNDVLPVADDDIPF